MDTVWHTVNQAIQHLLSNRPPHLMYPFGNALTNILGRTRECCCIRIPPMKLEFEVCPEVLNQIHVRRIWWPIVHDSKPVFRHCNVEKSFSFFACVSPSIVLL